MKTDRLIILVLAICMLSGCSKNSAPTQPAATQYSASAYGTAIVPGYAQYWSNGAWFVYGGQATINHVPYAYDSTSGETNYFYTPAGYCGFEPAGDSLIIFDNAPVAEFPATMYVGQTYTYHLLFEESGVGVDVAIHERLVDANSVGTPFGVLRCLHWDRTTDISQSNGPTGSDTDEVWIAPGIGLVKEITPDGYVVVMTSGNVNGHQYGTLTPAMGRKNAASQSKKSGNIDTIVKCALRRLW